MLTKPLSNINLTHKHTNVNKFAPRKLTTFNNENFKSFITSCYYLQPN